jgi:O-antigen ligase
MGMGQPEFAMMGLCVMAILAFIWADTSSWFWSLFGFFAACSVEKNIMGGMVLNLPAEPLSAILLLRFFHLLLLGKISKNVWMHPLSILFLLYVFWMLVACMQSSMPMVSFKQALLRLSFISVFYFLCLHELLSNKDFFRKTGTWFLIGFLPVVLYILIYHSFFQFSKDASGFSARPFFHDHTQYAAVICLLLPWFIRYKRMHMLLLLFLLVALYLSYCRAAYISLILSFFVLCHYRMGLSHRSMMVIIFFAGMFTLWSMDSLYNNFKANKSDSNAKYAGVAEQARSITNITTDQSNAERINRWKSALRMIAYSPVFGFGPATYQFAYLPFQRSADMTRISVTNPNNHLDGRGGTAHNEYLLHASEMGIPAMIIYVLICLLGIYKAFLQGSSQLAGMAICTYFFHGFFNNFLDTVSVSFLFYATLALIAANDIKSMNKD